MVNPFSQHYIVINLASKSTNILIINYFNLFCLLNLYFSFGFLFYLFFVILFFSLYIHFLLILNLIFFQYFLLFLYYLMLSLTLTLSYIILIPIFLSLSFFTIIFSHTSPYNFPLPILNNNILPHLPISNFLIQLLHSLNMRYLLLFLPKIANFLILNNFTFIFLDHMFIHFFMNLNKM